MKATIVGGEQSSEGRDHLARVYLVGAGPGDPGLLTRRAAGLLRRADVVVHDALVGRAILELVAPDAEVIDVGKRCGGRHTRQGWINDLLIERSRSAAKIVVRLKGGDPFVFGRGGEEALALHEAGVPFRIVPGITAAVGVSAYAGIPLTHRGLSSSVTFVTGHECTGKRTDGVDWDALGRLDGTLAIYMGVGALARIAGRLVAAGRSPSTPAAVIEWGTYARQRTVTGPLAQIAALAMASGIGAPALVVVGEVAALHERLSWFDQRPLSGVRILVGRSRPQRSRIAAALSHMGADVLEHPILRVAPAPRPANVDAGFSTLSRTDWVVFTSSAAVSRFWVEAADRGLDSRCLGAVRVAAFGQATADALRSCGIVADVHVRNFRPERALAEFARFGPLSGKQVLFPREAHLDSPIAAAIRAAGARVEELEIFRTVVDETPDHFHREDALPHPDFIVLPSSSSALAIADLPEASQPGIRVVAIGERTAATARSHGLRVDAVAGRSTVEGIVRVIQDLVAEAERPIRADTAAMDGVRLVLA
ncbi:MAG: uroporphyrinogen-III C-methyltransferase [Gemmatimonadota bacterium]